MYHTLLIIRSVVFVGLGLLFIVVPISGRLDVEGIVPKAALALLGLLIIGREAWSWKRRLSAPDDK